MYGDQCGTPFIASLTFLQTAEVNKSMNGFMCCPCRRCGNNKEYSNRKTLHGHIYRWVFMEKYICWTKHGERGVVMKDGEEDDYDDNSIPADWAEGDKFSVFSNGVKVDKNVTKMHELTN
jgi:hypothetical protein